MFCGGHHLFGAKGPSQLTHFAPSLFPLGQGYVTLCFGVPTTSVEARGEREQSEQEGSDREQGEQEGSERGQEGARGARGSDGVRGSEGSEMNVMLGFKAPTTSGRKNFDDDI